MTPHEKRHAEVAMAFELQLLAFAIAIGAFLVLFFAPSASDADTRGLMRGIAAIILAIGVVASAFSVAYAPKDP